MSNKENLTEIFRNEFKQEFTGLFETFFLFLAELTQSETRPNGIRGIFRVCHTLKSTGRAVGFDQIGNLSSQMESCLSVLRIHPEIMEQGDIHLFVEAMKLIHMHLHDESTDLTKITDLVFTRFNELKAKLIREEHPGSQRLKKSFSLPNAKCSDGSGNFEKTEDIGKIFNLAKIVVDKTATSLHKTVTLHCFHCDSKVPRVVVETIKDPILQLVRNAVDHGLESDQDRKLLWKEVPSKVYLKALRIEKRIVIEVLDDGRGVDQKAIFERAKVLGLSIPTEKPESMTDAMILEILCKEGFSSKNSITETSGRGVGLDIVKTAVEKLGGSFLFFNRPGRGALFKIRIPCNWNES